MCEQCAAERYLEPDDWTVLEFYQCVADQCINQAPMGTKDGKPYTTPRLEAYEAACRVFGVPESRRPGLVEMAMWVHHAREGRHGMMLLEAHKMTPADLAPPEFDHGC